MSAPIRADSPAAKAALGMVKATQEVCEFLKNIEIVPPAMQELIRAINAPESSAKGEKFVSSPVGGEDLYGSPKHLRISTRDLRDFMQAADQLQLAIFRFQTSQLNRRLQQP